MFTHYFRVIGHLTSHWLRNHLSCVKSSKITFLLCGAGLESCWQQEAVCSNSRSAQSDNRRVAARAVMSFQQPLPLLRLPLCLYCYRIQFYSGTSPLRFLHIYSCTSVLAFLFLPLHFYFWTFILAPLFLHFYSGHSLSVLTLPSVYIMQCTCARKHSSGTHWVCVGYVLGKH